jgi:uncharacterized glyoxalase superfamily protein PhnB
MTALVPYIAVLDARSAIAGYGRVLGAVERTEAVVMPDGRVGHAELDIGGSVLFLADEFPEIGLAAPRTRGGASASLHLTVPDPDAVVDRAREAGWEVERSVADQPAGRGGVVIDPSGHRWMIQQERG